jgi:multidrug transporter EmrE-like cation transporter
VEHKKPALYGPLRGVCALMIYYLFILASIVLITYAQLILKWQIQGMGPFPNSLRDQIHFLLNLVTNPWVLGNFIAGFLAVGCWMVALTHLQLSKSYPWTSLSFVLVTLFSALFFQEPLSWVKFLGLLFIIAGILIGSRG